MSLRAGAILLCAGRGERLGAGLDKALVPLAGRPLFAWSLEALERCEAVEAIVVVGPVRTLREALAATGLAARKVVAWTEGGDERQHSVGRGLHVLPGDCDVVAVHDCARALVSPEVIARTIEAARAHGAAIAAVPLADTLKRVEDGRITATPPREGLWRAQTPQAFRLDWLLAAHEAAARDRRLATDDAALVEAIGHPVRVTAGDPMNLKIMTPDDLSLAEAWLARRSVAAERGGGAR